MISGEVGESENSGKPILAANAWAVLQRVCWLWRKFFLIFLSPSLNFIRFLHSSLPDLLSKIVTFPDPIDTLFYSSLPIFSLRMLYFYFWNILCLLEFSIWKIQKFKKKDQSSGKNRRRHRNERLTANYLFSWPYLIPFHQKGWIYFLPHRFLSHICF